jgi:hypothetical protein
MNILKYEWNFSMVNSEYTSIFYKGNSVKKFINNWETMIKTLSQYSG